jgi:hypothetical protein
VLGFILALIVQLTSGDGMRFEVILPDSVRLGAPVPIVLRLTNAGDRPLTLYLQGRPLAFDITVSDRNGQVVWRRLEGEVLQSILAIRTLEPGAVLELRDTWTQQTDAGHPVSPGNYLVIGSLPTDRPEPLRTPPRTLHIVP